MTVTQSTFSATQEKFSQQPEPVPTEAKVETPTPDVIPPVDTPENNSPEPPVPTPASEASDFIDFSLESEAPINNSNNEQSAVQQPQPSFNWKDEIKKLNPDEVLAEIGIDPFAINVDKHIKKGGKPVDYFAANAVDYNNVSDEKLLKDKLREDSPNLSSSQVDILYKRKYEPPIDATEEDIEFYDAQLKSEAYRVRQQKISEQKNFTFPDSVKMPEDEGYKQYKEQLESLKQQSERQASFYNNHSATKNLLESKRVTINLGEGVPPFNFNLDKPEMITNALTDSGETMQRLLSTESGEPDVAKEQLLTLFAYNPQKFIQTIFNYGKQQGVYQKLVGENQNAQRPSATVLPMSSDAKPVFKTGTFGALRQQ